MPANWAVVFSKKCPRCHSTLNLSHTIKKKVDGANIYEKWVCRGCNYIEEVDSRSS